jgi:hypothetical protein
LGDTNTFLWRERLLQERLMRNISALQEQVLLCVRGLVEAGLTQFTHSAVAEACRVGVGTVKDALRRAQGVGLLAWQAEYRPGPNGVRRRTANSYRLTMPEQSPAPRPDLRRRAPLVSKRPPLEPILPTCSPHCGEPGWRPPRGFEERFATRVAEEKRLRAGQFARGSPR